MTVSTTNRLITFVGDGTTSIFAFNFKAIDTGSVKAFVDGIEDTNLTVLLNADQETNAGGTCQFNSPPTSGSEVAVLRDSIADQLLDYPLGGNFPSVSHESGLDKLTMLIQEAEEIAIRGLRFPEFESSTSPTTLPKQSDRANKILSFDGNGDYLLIPEINAETFDTLATLQSEADELTIGKHYRVIERTTGNGGGAYWKAIAKTTENGFDIVSGNANTSLQLVFSNVIDLAKFGCILDGVTENSTAFKHAVSLVNDNGIIFQPHGVLLAESTITDDGSGDLNQHTILLEDKKGVKFVGLNLKQNTTVGAQNGGMIALKDCTQIEVQANGEGSGLASAYVVCIMGACSEIRATGNATVCGGFANVRSTDLTHITPRPYNIIIDCFAKGCDRAVIAQYVGSHCRYKIIADGCSRTLIVAGSHKAAIWEAQATNNITSGPLLISGFHSTDVIENQIMDVNIDTTPSNPFVFTTPIIAGVKGVIRNITVSGNIANTASGSQCIEISQFGDSGSEFKNIDMSNVKLTSAGTSAAFLLVPDHSSAVIDNIKLPYIVDHLTGDAMRIDNSVGATISNVVVQGGKSSAGSSSIFFRSNGGLITNLHIGGAIDHTGAQDSIIITNVRGLYLGVTHPLIMPNKRMILSGCTDVVLGKIVSRSASYIISSIIDGFHADGVTKMHLTNAPSYLNTLNAGMKGQIIDIMSESITMTVVHGTGVNNIALNGATNYLMTPRSTLTIEHNGSHWVERSRSVN